MADQEELAPAADVEQEVCYRHPDRPTRLHCSRCDRPICGSCATPASVGQHCPECVAEGRRTMRQPKSVLRATAPVVWTLVIANVAVYILEVILGEAFIQRFVSFPPAIADGDWYRLLTAMFLHAPLGARFGIIHILFNMYILSVYGSELERAVGPIRFIALYLTAGLAASAASYAFGSCVQGLGASGAIFGLIGVLVVFLYKRRRSALLNQYFKGLLIFVGFNLLLGFVMAGIDNIAHIGGLVSGLVLGVGFDHPDLKSSSAAPRQIATVVVVLAATIALVVWRTATFSCF